ncbi:MAG: serine hydrolase [Woeseia sp.]
MPTAALPAFLLLLLPAAHAHAQYFPAPHIWEHVEAELAGFDSVSLQHAVSFARSGAETEPADLHQVIHDAFAPREPDFRILGPTKNRAGDSGVVVRGGRIVAEWGDVDRTDMTFSVAKSYLSMIAAIAIRDGLIRSADDRAAAYIPDPLFDGEHNGVITWHHLLQQTSDWSGELWDIHDWADRPEGDDPEQWPRRRLYEPGTRFKYNDVRVNLLALGLLQVLREPLPQVLLREIMRPIGASSTWRWYGYENSWVELDGLKIQSVSGGGHFGGGLVISTRDHARFGLLMLNRGEWAGERLLPASWFERMREPSAAQPDYGYLWWLNTGRKRIPAAPESAYWAAGFGGNYIYIDECNDLLIVLRWIPDLPGVVEQVMRSMNDPRTSCSG